MRPAGFWKNKCLFYNLAMNDDTGDVATIAYL